MRRKTADVVAVDLFAGAGGASSGLVAACKDLGLHTDLVAVNHWDVAIATHETNHPKTGRGNLRHAEHFHAPVEALDPREAVPNGRVDILIAAPECTHFSTARGGRPVNDQSRASAWHVLRWLELLRVEVMLVENVPEFLQWGPIGADGRPIQSKKGETFRAWFAAVESLGYRGDWRILNAADYGEATTRRRLFVQFRRLRTGGPISWPEPTHARRPRPTLLRGDLRRWRPAREVIDWEIPGESIFTRKKPLAKKTLQRIAAGARRFWGLELEPFLMHLTHGGRAHSIDEPVPTVTSANRGELAVVQPFVTVLRNHQDAQSADEPLPAITAGGTHAAVCQAFLIPFLGERKGQEPRVRSIDEPLQTVTASNGIGLAEPFVVMNNANNVPKSLDDPVPTITGGNRAYLCSPFVLQQQSGGVPRAVDDPLPTVAAKGAVSVVEPFLVRYNATGGPESIHDPLGVVTTRNRFGLVLPGLEGAVLDIRFRMLQPHELAAAMGFPADYQFQGTKTDTVRQIGNAISVRTMQALCREALVSLRSKFRAVAAEQRKEGAA